MTKKPLVSAIVVNWNGRRMLRECLDSLFAQTWTELEVILVDNASTDGSGEEARAHWGERLRYLQNARNEGFARGNNQGFAIARGEWVFILNNDAVAEPRAVEELMAFVATHEAAAAGAAGRSHAIDVGPGRTSVAVGGTPPRLGMLACRVVRYDEPVFIDSVGLLLYPDGTCRPRGWEEKDTGQYDRPDEVLAPHGCAAAYRRAMLTEVGGFDEDYFAYMEDLDLGFRAQLCRWSCWYVPGARVRHRKSATAGNASKFKAFHVERNRIYNAIKLLPRFILFMSPFFALNRYLLQAYAAATHRGISSEFVEKYSVLRSVWIVLRAHCAALVRLPRMLRKRRELSRQRKLSTAEWYFLISRFKLDAIELALKW